MKLEQQNEQVTEMAATAGAYVLWGILPVYWKLVEQVPSHEILAHRILWSFFFTAFLLLGTQKINSFIQETREMIAQPKKFLVIVAASFLISANWFIYIWAVNNNRIIETSLGYYINPLVSVLLGIIVFKEKLSFWQKVSFGLAAIGVCNMTLHFGAIPWVALLLAGSFGLYGLFKKMATLGAITGITLETLIISPLALLYLSYLYRNGTGAFGLDDPVTSGFLMGAGIVTAVPLILFSSGAKRLPLSILGFLQYIAPTIALILGVFVYHERFTGVHLVSFAFIWLALTVFSLARTKPFVQFESMLIKKVAVQNK
ncbi:EamA family transporter RarD [Desulforamulus ruminis]|uniref:RarD protein, DMT superfamily transporter n=1 Tax=Desulforamulus ruminis (strain ATCC 23193 / DSM 2154 / NCIMB 8452 / DL) TaxID=696281 RepID=F6DS19_DESRL|nr:EamA family transporter RarD [Desulforamulus ruminis]AEG58781.1 RarD protein, DMT superfamily transporter [Desulforamulus ruminis DSM 2154]